MSSFIVVLCHRIIGITASYCGFMFLQYLPWPAFSVAYVEAAALALQSVDNVSGVAVGEASNLVGFLSEDNYEVVCFYNVTAVVAPTTSVGSYRTITMKPGRRVGSSGWRVASDTYSRWRRPWLLWRYCSLVARSNDFCSTALSAFTETHLTPLIPDEAVELVDFSLHRADCDFETFNKS